MASMIGHEIHAIARSSGLGRSALALDDDEILTLLKTAVKREGCQAAFAKHHRINRTYLNMVLGGKRAILRKAYVIE